MVIRGLRGYLSCHVENSFDASTIMPRRKYEDTSNCKTEDMGTVTALRTQCQEISMLTHVLVLIKSLLLTDLESFSLIGKQVMLAMRGHLDCFWCLDWLAG
jgi:hypothetical protein